MRFLSILTALVVLVAIPLGFVSVLICEHLTHGGFLVIAVLVALACWVAADWLDRKLG